MSLSKVNRNMDLMLPVLDFIVTNDPFECHLSSLLNTKYHKTTRHEASMFLDFFLLECSILLWLANL